MAGREQLLCWVELPCLLEMHQDLWRYPPPQISTILVPAQPPRRLEQAGNTAPFLPAPLGVTLEKLLFACGASPLDIDAQPYTCLCS